MMITGGFAFSVILFRGFKMSLWVRIDLVFTRTKMTENFKKKGFLELKNSPVN